MLTEISQGFIPPNIYNKNKKSWFYPNCTVMENITVKESRKRPKSVAVGKIKNFFFRKEPLELYWSRKFSFFFPKSISTIVKNIFNEGNVWKKFFKVKKIKKLRKKKDIFSPNFVFTGEFDHFLNTKQILGTVFRNNIYNPRIKASMYASPSDPPQSTPFP